MIISDYQYVGGMIQDFFTDTKGDCQLKYENNTIFDIIIGGDSNRTDHVCTWIKNDMEDNVYFNDWQYPRVGIALMSGTLFKTPDG